MRAVIINGGGTILRTITAPEAIVAIQAGVGETALALSSPDAGFVDDSVVQVSGGVFAPVGSYEGDMPVSDLAPL